MPPIFFALGRGFGRVCKIIILLLPSGHVGGTLDDSGFEGMGRFAHGVSSDLSLLVSGVFGLEAEGSRSVRSVALRSCLEFRGPGEWAGLFHRSSTRKGRVMVSACRRRFSGWL